jgi:hypothetical protein
VTETELKPWRDDWAGRSYLDEGRQDEDVVAGYAGRLAAVLAG